MVTEPEMTPYEIECLDAIISDIRELLPILYLIDGEDRESQHREYEIIMAEVERRLEELA
jgi:hypothetical protein